jgi:hypothetical protein
MSSNKSQKEKTNILIFGDENSGKNNIVNFIIDKQDEYERLKTDYPKIKMNTGLDLQFITINDEERDMIKFGMSITNIFKLSKVAIYVNNSDIMDLSRFVKWRYDMGDLIPSDMKWIMVDMPIRSHISNPKEFYEMFKTLLPKDMYFYINTTRKQFYIESMLELMRYLKMEIKVN